MKIKVSKKWCQRSAEIEGESSVGAGAIGPLMGGSERRLVRLVAEWRSKADHCEAEIARSKKKNPSLHLSTEDRICYEQAARTLRQCAALLESEVNAEVKRGDATA